MLLGVKGGHFFPELSKTEKQNDLANILVERFGDKMALERFIGPLRFTGL